MFNMGSLSTNLMCEPSLAVFLALKLQRYRLPYHTNHLLCTTQPPSLPVNSVDVEKRTEQECFNAVHDTLRTKAGAESLLPVMWSLYHAARSDVVGQCRKSVEALLPLFYEKAASHRDGLACELLWQIFSSVVEDIANQD